MGQLNATVDDALEKRFRDKAADKFGMNKWTLARAMSEALEHWVSEAED